jgi:hypothetical protein
VARLASIGCLIATLTVAAPGSDQARPAARGDGRIEVLRAVGGLPAHVAGAFQDPIAFQQGPGGRYYIFDRRAHAVFAVDPGIDTPLKLVQIGGEPGRLLQPSAFDLDPATGTFVVADAPSLLERVQVFDLQGLRLGGFTLPGKAAARVTLGSLVLNGVGSLQFTGRSVLINQPETGALVTEYSLTGVPFRTFGSLRSTGHEAERDLHLALNVAMPLVNPRGGFYVVFLTGVPLYRAYDADGRLRFERHIEGPEVDETLASLPTVWPRRPGNRDELPLMTPGVRTAAVDADGHLWVSLAQPVVYVYDTSGDKRRTVQFRGATGAVAPASLAFPPRSNRVLVAPGLYEFRTR